MAKNYSRHHRSAKLVERFYRTGALMMLGCAGRSVISGTVVMDPEVDNLKPHLLDTENEGNTLPIPPMTEYSEQEIAEMPLLRMTQQIPFDRITTDQVVPTIEALLVKAAVLRDQIIHLDTAERTFDNTILGFEAVTAHLDYAFRVFEHLESVQTSEELKDAITEIEPKVSEFVSQLTRTQELWDAIVEYSQSDDVLTLDPYQNRYLKLVLEKFRKDGADLSIDVRARLTEIDIKIKELTTKFKHNVVSATAEFEYIINSRDGLSGLPESAIEAARESANSKDRDGWRFTLQGPSYSAVLKYHDDASVREALYRAYYSRCSSGEFDNSQIVAQIWELRHERAQLLGFSHFTDLTTSDRMAKSGVHASQFLDGLESELKEPWLAEADELYQFRVSLEGEDAPALMPWDKAYYAEKLRKAQYDFDAEELRPYFEYNNILQGFFQLTQTIFGVTIKPLEGVSTWSEEVGAFGVYDGEVLLATFYTDFFPRDEKRSGAWMDTLYDGKYSKDQHEPHASFIAGNFPAPTGTKPSLLKHANVLTLAHECGHMLSQALSEVPIASLNALYVPWDFVEFHSQLMENWLWEKDVLKEMSSHYETNDKIPDELIDKMMRAKNFRAASMYMRGVSLGRLDLAIHSDYNPKEHGDIHEFARSVLQRYSIEPIEEDFSMLNIFTHLFDDPVGYAGGYYSYQYSEAVEAFAFTRFKKEGIVNPSTGRSLRYDVFAPAYSKEPEDLIKAFMGDSELDSRAMLRRAGIGEAKSQ